MKTTIKNFPLLLGIIASSLNFFSMEANGMTKQTIYDFSVDRLNSEEKLNFSDYKGKLLLLVNTASECGFTPQYQELQKLYEQYKQKGLEIVALPCNDFGSQEPGNSETISNFTKDKYAITFPITSKINITSKPCHPIFTWLNEELGWFAMPKWNFYKYLISPEGKPITWFASTTSPSSTRLTSEIDKYLPNNN